MMPVWTKFRNALRAFRVARGGNVAITFAFATLPIIATVGYAVDYSRANSVKVAMQAALDSTALMISKEAATDTPAQLQSNAQKYFLALFNRTDVKNITVTANYSNTNGTQVVISSTVDVPTTILAAVGWDTLTVGNSSTVRWGSSRLRVALVLDNTGSMADSGKITALKTATANLLTQLQNAAAVNGDVYVSIVPFVKDVNLDPSNWSSDYIYWGTATADNNVNNPSDPIQDSTASDNTSWNANYGKCYNGSTQVNYSPRSSCVQHGSCSISGNNSQTSCTGAGVCSNPVETSQNNCTGNKACTKSQYTSKTNCQNNGGTWGYGTWSSGVWTSYTWTPYAHNDSTHGWNGCVMDRGYPASPSYLTVSGSNKSGPDTTYNFDTNAAAVDLVTPRMSSLYPAEQYSSCPQAVMGLSYNWTAMNSLVNAMSPNGNTNQAIGLQLGWMSLVGGGPFTAPAMDPNYTYSQVIILLTDGLNTQNRWTSTQSSIDARQQLTCNNINAAGITLYTIQVNTDGEATSTLLQNCAGTAATATTAAVYPDPSKFFLLTSSDAIVTTFNSIGTKLSNLYVAR